MFILAGIAGGLDPHLVALGRLASLALYTYHAISSRFSQVNWLSYNWLPTFLLIKAYTVQDCTILEAFRNRLIDFNPFLLSITVVQF